MIFSSPEFIFAFLPVTLLSVILAARFVSARAGIAILTIASFVFYAWCYPPFLILLTASILGNFAFGLLIERRRRLVLLGIAIGFNLAALIYFKYAGFFAGIANALTGSGFEVANIALPLAISFFTFQQIAYLVDVYRGVAYDRDFLRYCLFVTFFPHLIAGPIVHHREMMPQFEAASGLVGRSRDLWVGAVIAVIGLAKKVVIADSMGVYADHVFAAAGDGLGLVDTWGGVLAFGFQIYFDFSGYSDMAIGIARMFGIRLPLNFHSPYQATSIIDFWRRWHITLSRFLRDYLYVPLGGNRRGPTRRYVNLMITMLLGGLWHGANWTFVVWGGLHGLFLIVNHAWQKMPWYGQLGVPRCIAVSAARLLTLAAVMVAWVFFRAADWASAQAMLAGMAGRNGVSVDASRFFEPLDLIWIAIVFAIVSFLPNTQQLMARYEPAFAAKYFGADESSTRAGSSLVAEIGPLWCIAFSLAAIVPVLLIMFSRGNPPSFIYFVF